MLQFVAVCGLQRETPGAGISERSRLLVEVLDVVVVCGVVQRIAVCCSVLQCVAVCCSVLQCAAVCCSA